MKEFVKVTNDNQSVSFDIDHLRDIWFRTSYLLDRRQCGTELALERFRNYKNHDLKFNTLNFQGTFKSLGISPDRQKKIGNQRSNNQGKRS